jgi:hypothetical protein
MDNKLSRYANFERYITLVLIVSTILFIIYMIASGCGIIWLKVLCAILAILAPGLCLYMLYLTKELLRQRSLWMTVGAVAIIICTLLSLILNFPSPKPIL